MPCSKRGQNCNILFIFSFFCREEVTERDAVDITMSSAPETTSTTSMTAPYNNSVHKPIDICKFWRIPHLHHIHLITSTIINSSIHILIHSFTDSLPINFQVVTFHRLRRTHFPCFAMSAWNPRSSPISWTSNVSRRVISRHRASRRNRTLLETVTAVAMQVLSPQGVNVNTPTIRTATQGRCNTKGSFATKKSRCTVKVQRTRPAGTTQRVWIRRTYRCCFSLSS